MMNNRKLVYFFALLFTVAFAASAVGQAPPHPENPETTTTATPVSPEAMADFTASAHLENADGNALPDYEILFIFGKDANGDGNIDEGTEIARDTATTDTNGDASVTFTAPDTEGDYDYKAYFGGSTDPSYDSSQDVVDVTVEKVPTVLEVRTINLSKRDCPGYRIKGRYSFSKIKQFYESGDKLESCVFIHTPFPVRGWFS